MKSQFLFSPRITAWLIFGQPLLAMGVVIAYILYALCDIQLSATSPQSLSSLRLAIVVLLSFGIVGSLTSNILSWIVSVAATFASLWIWGRARLEILLVLTPLLGLLLWYGYDRFVPDGGFPTAETPYEHGLTWLRFGKAWLIEIAIICAYWFPLRKIK